MTSLLPLRLALSPAILALAVLLAPALALSEPAAAGSIPAAFLDAQGRLDLDALLDSGYRGPIDLRGLQVTGHVPVDRERFREVEVLDRERQSRPVREQDGGNLAPNGSPGCWLDQFPVPGIVGSVNAALIYDGKIIVGGSFSVAGNYADNVATWDGVAWSPVGSGTNGEVRSLAVWNSLLIAGGSFTVAGGVGANRIAAWNGSAWSPLGDGLSGAAQAMTVLGSDLIAAGDFTVAGTVYANRVARWDGAQWSALGDGLNGDGDAAIVFNGDVVVAGNFTAAGTTIANGIAAWDGGAWNPLGPGIPSGGIETLAVHGGVLVAGGSFEDIGLAGPPYLATWNGVTWSGLGTPQNTVVSRLGVVAGQLYLSTGPQGIPAPDGASFEIRQWNGAAWILLGDTDYAVNAFLEWGGELALLLPADSNFVIGGTWDGVTWSLFPNAGIDDDVKAAEIFQGDLVIAGDFDRVDTIEFPAIARWDGVTWSPLGNGIAGDVFALEADGTDLYVGGNFTEAGSVAALGIARWDDLTSSWNALGTGLAGSPVEVHAIEKHNGVIFVGGRFDSAGGIPAYNIATWDGAAWDSLGSVPIDPVRSLLSFSGGLAVGVTRSWFSELLLVWDGIQWQTPGPFSPANWYSSVLSLAEYNGDLVIGGVFDAQDNAGYCGIARWDGGQWVNLGAGLSGIHGGDRPQVNALTVHDGTLVAGGRFGLPGAGTMEHLGAWIGSDWGSIGNGVSTGEDSADVDIVACLASWESQLVVGGNFVMAGDVVSCQLAVWDCALTSDVRGVQWNAATTGLLPVSPNPFTAATTIRYRLAASSAVDLTVYDILGRRVRTLRTTRTQSSGRYAEPWDGRDDSGRVVAPGTYFVRLRAGGTSQTGKLTLLR